MFPALFPPAGGALSRHYTHTDVTLHNEHVTSCRDARQSVVVCNHGNQRPLMSTAEEKNSVTLLLY